MSTLTTTQVQGVVDGRYPPPADPQRINVLHVKYTSNGSSVSSGDVIQFVALPAWSRVIGGMLLRATTPVDSMVFSIGFTGGTSFSSGSWSTTTGVAMNRISLNAGTLLSISEGAALQFDTLDLTVVSASATVTCDLHVWVSYTYEPWLRS